MIALVNIFLSNMIFQCKDLTSFSITFGSVNLGLDFVYAFGFTVGLKVFRANITRKKKGKYLQTCSYLPIRVCFAI